MKISRLFTALAVSIAFIAVPSPLLSQITVVPMPQTVRLRPGKVTIPAAAKVYMAPKARISAAYLTSRLADAGITPTFVKDAGKADIAVSLGKGAGKKEGYKLTLTENGKPAVSAVADDRNGALYAVESIVQILKNDGAGHLTANAGTVTDFPEFEWRDYMLDESRHFHGMANVKRLLDEMVRLKMNTFHWHLVDDPGWRIEIKGYPKLTEEGSLSDFSHFFEGAEKWKQVHPERAYYTQKEIKEIVAYAGERGIKVIPEIEVPGHCYAATHMYPELQTPVTDPQDETKLSSIYNVISPKFKKFIETTLTQVIALFPAKIIHIGGDEANYDRWSKNKDINEFMKAHGLKTYPDMQLYAINSIQKFLEKKGVRLVGWNEITGDNVHNEQGRGENSAVHLDANAIVQFWDGSTDLAKKAIRKGYHLINSNRIYTYLDYNYATIPIDKAYSFNPYFEDLTDEQNSKIIGTGCQMWGEWTPNEDRLNFQTFPRLGAYAECGWTKNENKNYADFVRRIAPVEQIWKAKGYFCGQPSYSMGVTKAEK